jgi:hypothetical protein
MEERTSWAVKRRLERTARKEVVRGRCMILR